jgi:DNA gyrase/topoisomerase IV subunit A
MPEADLPPGEVERRARLRLSILDAYLLATERRADVMNAVAEARGPHEARRSVAHQLGISEDAASGVLDLRLQRFSQTEVAAIRAEAEDIRSTLDRAR